MKMLTPVLQSTGILDSPNVPAPLITEKREAPLGDDELLDSYSRTVNSVVEKVSPAVVNIRVQHVNATRSGHSGPESGSIQRRTINNRRCRDCDGQELQGDRSSRRTSGAIEPVAPIRCDPGTRQPQHVGAGGVRSA